MHFTAFNKASPPTPPSTPQLRVWIFWLLYPRPARGLSQSPVSSGPLLLPIHLTSLFANGRGGGARPRGGPLPAHSPGGDAVRAPAGPASPPPAPAILSRYAPGEGGEGGAGKQEEGSGPAAGRDAA